jgi:hypothetical protein
MDMNTKLQMRSASLHRLCLLWLLFLIPLNGCGSGNQLNINRAATGRATFTVVWPANGRLIPAAANSILVQVLQGGAVVADTILARPTAGGPATAAFTSLPIGTLTATATAYPTTTGTGVAQAIASVPLTIQANQNTSFSLTMASTIDHLVLTPANPSVIVGQTTTLTATAVDAAGNIVLTSPSKLQWTSSSGAASVADGVVTGLAPGSATIGVTEQESGKSASVTVTVTNPTTFTINGKQYIVSTPQETLTATFTVPDGGVSVSSYSGYVLVNVTGVGQSYVTDYNDAFYLYTGFNPPVNGHDGGYYQLAFGTSPLMAFDLGNNAVNSLVGSVPPYTATHNYTVILNTKLTTPGQLHFGVSDGGFSDNTGAYTIIVTQLVPAP